MKGLMLTLYLITRLESKTWRISYLRTHSSHMPGPSFDANDGSFLKWVDGSGDDRFKTQESPTD